MSEDQSLEKGSKGQEETVYSVCLASGKGFLLSMVRGLGSPGYHRGLST